MINDERPITAMDALGFADRTLVALWSEWSEEMYCASFLIDAPEFIDQFIGWLLEGDNPFYRVRPLEQYEVDTVRKIRERLLKEATEDGT